MGKFIQLILQIIFVVRVVQACNLNSGMYDVGQLNLEKSFNDDTKNFRLGNESIPSKYVLKIKPFMTTQTKLFEGEVEIYFKVTEEVNKVVFNQEDIELTVYELYKAGEEAKQPSNQITIDKCVPDNKYQKYECKLLEGVLDPKEEYILYLKYIGKIHDDMRGLYESYYFDENKKKKPFGLTYFGQQARRLLPCFDEPRYKAQFEITIVRNPKIHTLSIANAQFVETLEVNETFVFDVYKPTSKIPSHALALFVTNFGEILDFDVRGNHTFGTYAREDVLDQLSYAFQLSPKLIRQLNEWTNLNYYKINGVDKIDIVAVPDYPVKGMANWGLLIQRENYLLKDDHHTNTLQKERIGLMLSHEISHMWFGILVTCDWFDVIWLNEGFATYFEFLTLDAIHSEWNVMNSFVPLRLQSSLQPDAFRSAHPLTYPGVNSYPEIQSLLTTITYNKGASILRMMHNLLRPGIFQIAVRGYLESKLFSTVIPEDLFILFERHDPDINPTAIMKSYTEQPGFPLVTVKKEKNVLKLVQKRFLYESVNHTDTSTWHIPITLALNIQDFDNTRSHLILFPKENTFEIKINEPSLGFYLLNIQQIGYYRVNYDSNNWLAIKKALYTKDFGGIHVLNRVQIIDDLFNLARVGYLKYDFVLDIIKYVKTEKEYLPWLATLNGLSFLETRFNDTDFKKQFNVFVNEILDDIYSYLEFASNGTHTEKLNRINILNWACRYGNEKCIKLANSKFEAILKDEVIDPDWMLSVYCTAARNDTKNWDKLWNKYKNSNFATEKETILTALGCSKDQKNIHSLLDKILTEDIRWQDKSDVYTNAFRGNPENVGYVLEYLLKNHEKWSKIMDLGTNLAELANYFTNDDQIKKLETFIKNTELSESTKTRLKSAIEISKQNIKWDQQRIDELKNYYNKNNASIQTYNFIVTILSVFIYFMFN